MRALEAETTSVPLDSLAEAIVLSGADGRIAVANPAAERLLGAGSGELVGRPLAELVPLAPDAAAAAAAPEGGALQSPVHRADGEQLVADVGYAALGNGEEAIVVVALRAVATEPDEPAADGVGALVARAQRRLAEATAARARLEALDVTGRLAGRVSHDLNNLLGVIRNFAQFAMEAVPAGSQSADDLTQIVRAVQRGLTLSQQLVVMGRREPLEPGPFGLDDAVDRALASSRAELGPRIEVRREQGEAVPAVEMDAHAAVRLVRDLVLHAGDMLPEGGTITAITRAGPAGHAQLVVMHTGPEIAEPPERPFEPRFAQLGEEEFPGLRLVVAQREATRARGTIAVEVAPGEATTVTVTLPVAVATR